MNIEELESVKSVPCFKDSVTESEWLTTYKNLQVMQINVGRLCNLTCKHCHLNAGPDRKEVMSKEVFNACLQTFKKHKFSVIDITGGAPEMNPHFEWFIGEASKITDKLIIRTNLVILLTEKYKHLPEFYKTHKVNIVCSLPFYSGKNTDLQRGSGTFEKSVRVIQFLNELGYGSNPELILDIVYNPLGASLPPAQKSMETLYKDRLYSNYKIVFNNLYTITNNPIGRFGDFLKATDNLDTYLKTLYNSFNLNTVKNMMCRNQISVSWDGYIYDCDFNQAADIKAEGQVTIFDLADGELRMRNIKTGKHCYACTAGAGSSCGGTTA